MKARLLLLAILTAICTVCPAQNDKGGGYTSADSVIVIKRDTVLLLRCDTLVRHYVDTLTAEELTDLLIMRHKPKNWRFILDEGLCSAIAANGGMEVEVPFVSPTSPATQVVIPSRAVAGISGLSPHSELQPVTERVVVADDDMTGDTVAVVDTVTVGKKKSKRLARMDREIQHLTFVPKGVWFGGATISYTEQEYDNLNYLLVKDINAKGYTFGVSPFVGYFIKKDLALGLRFTYNRSLLELNNFDLNLGEDFKINLKDMYYQEHDYQVAAFMRTYMPLGKSKVFGFFSEARLTYGHSTAKMLNGRYENGTLDGTYSQSDYLHIGFAPGMTAFVQDWMSVEVQLGIMGFSFKWTEQVTNQVEQGSQRSFGGKFNIDLFSISIGTTIYL